MQRVKLLELADLRRRQREERRGRKLLLQAERRERRRERWPRWVALWEQAARHLKTAAVVVGSAVAVISGGIALYKYASAGAHALRRAWTFYTDRDVGAPAQPPPTGIASTTIDRVPHPRPPPAPPPTED